MTTTYSIANYRSFDLLCSGYSYITNLPNEGCIDLVKKVAAIALGILLFLPTLVLDLVCTAVTCICGYDSKEPELADSSRFPMLQPSKKYPQGDNQAIYQAAFKATFPSFSTAVRLSMYTAVMENEVPSFFTREKICTATLLYKLINEHDPAFQALPMQQKEVLVRLITAGGSMKDLNKATVPIYYKIRAAADNLSEADQNANIQAAKNIIENLLTASGDLPTGATYNILTPWNKFPTDDTPVENRTKIIEYSLKKTFRSLPFDMRFFQLTQLQGFPQTESGWIKAAMWLCKIVNDDKLVPGFAKLATQEKENCVRILLSEDDEIAPIEAYYDVIQSMRKLLDEETLSNEDLQTAQRVGQEIEAELLNNKAMKL